MKKNSSLVPLPAIIYAKHRRVGYFSSCKAFTLIELLIVIAVLGILAGGILILINPIEHIAKAKDSAKKTIISQLANALQSYCALKGGQYPEANNTWITTLVNYGDLKSVPPPISYSCTIQQNGYCYKLSDDGTEAIVYASLESSERPSGTSGTTPYFLWSSKDSETGIYYSINSDITGTSGFIFGPDSTLTQGLVGWWKMNGNADDSTGNNNNGTVTGATLTTDKNGQFDKAYSFNGSSNYISVGTGASLDMSTNDFTISVWAKALGGQTGRGIVNKGGWGSIGYFISEAYSPANTYYFGITDSTGYKPISFAGEIWDWNHIVGIKTTNHLEVWVNGARVNQYNGTIGSLSNLTKAFEIGRSFNPYYFNGSIDDVRIYNRALSASEVKNLFYAGPQ